MKTYSAKAKDIEKKWYVIDAKDLILGRLAAVVSKYLKGKHKPTYTPSMDCGDNVVIINAEKVGLTGFKYYRKKYFWHTGFPGGIKSQTVEDILKSGQAEKIVKKAVERMVTRNPLGRKQMKNLYVYAGENHPHEAQKPEKLDVASMNSKNVKR
jgi:large subunit ribosomal protein L13